MKLVGITKVRNEGHIIRKTLDRWAQYCEAIFVYDDVSEDDTAEICRKHPAVVEVLTSSLFDNDRLRAEWYNRQTILKSAQRFDPEWIAYFDGDEWIYDFDMDLLYDPANKVIGCHWYDVYITPEDVNLAPEQRRWVAPECRQIPFFYRNSPYLGFSQPDQRIMHHEKIDTMQMSGVIKHWGKGWSEAIWQRKVQYYGHTFGRYAEKWRSRDGKAVHHDYKSDDGRPLVLWEHMRRAHATS